MSGPLSSRTHYPIETEGDRFDVSGQMQLLDDLREARDDPERPDPPKKLVFRCANLQYHDFASDYPLPKSRLMKDLKLAGFDELARNNRKGRYDP
jgi:hypothetical protein